MLNVRHYMELFGIKLIEKYPEILEKYCIPYLSNYKLSNQTITTIIIISGNCVIHNSNTSKTTQLKVVKYLLPWLSCSDGLVRTIAQYITYELLHIILNISHNELNDICKDPESIESNYLYGTYKMLSENPKLVKMRKRQSVFFNDFNPSVKCTLESLLSTPNEGGDYMPITLVQSVQNEMYEVFNEFYNDEPFSESSQAELKKEKNQLIIDNYMSNHACIILYNLVSFNYQKKILPWNNIDSPFDIDENDSRNNYSQRIRQSIIVVASLIDKLYINIL